MDQEFADRADMRFEGLEIMLGRFGQHIKDLEDEVKQAKSMSVSTEKLASRFADDALAGQEQLEAQLQR